MSEESLYNNPTNQQDALKELQDHVDSNPLTPPTPLEIIGEQETIVKEINDVFNNSPKEFPIALKSFVQKNIDKDNGRELLDTLFSGKITYSDVDGVLYGMIDVLAEKGDLSFARGLASRMTDPWAQFGAYINIFDRNKSAEGVVLALDGARGALDKIPDHNDKTEELSLLCYKYAGLGYLYDAEMLADGIKDEQKKQELYMHLAQVGIDGICPLDSLKRIVGKITNEADRKLLEAKIQEKEKPVVGEAISVEQQPQQVVPKEKEEENKNEKNEDGDENEEDIVKIERKEKLPEIDIEENPNIEKNLSDARKAYASARNQFKNDVRAQKTRRQKLLHDLGVVAEAQMPLQDRPDYIKTAEANYIKAKEEKANWITEQIKLKYQIDSEKKAEIAKNLLISKILKEVTDERELLTQEILNVLPPVEKGIITKAIEKWGALPQWKRIAISTTVMTTLAMTTGVAMSGGVAGVAAYAGWRAARGAFGAGAAKLTGMSVEALQEGRNKSKESNALNEYITDLTDDHFEKAEQKLMQFFDKQENIKKKQRFQRAVAMLAVGAGASVGTGLAQSHFAPEVAQGTGVGNALREKIGQGKVTGSGAPEQLSQQKTLADSGIKLSDQRPKPTLDNSGTPVKASPEVVSSQKPESIAEVELSSKGFIKTFDDMKAQLTDQYRGVGNVPANAKHIMDTPSVKLAQEYGFYDAKTHLSGTGLKGEMLKLDDHGNLIYSHAGKQDILTSEHKFGGPMREYGVKHEAMPKAEPVSEKTFGLKQEPTVRAEETGQRWGNQDKFGNVEDRLHEPQVETTQIGTGGSHKFDSLSTPEAVPASKISYSIEHKGHSVSITETDKGNMVLIDKTPVGHEQLFNGKKIFVLDEKFQNLNKNAPVREAFTEITARRPDIMELGKRTTNIPFEGGRIQVVEGLDNNPKLVKLLLNGKEIGKGVMTEHGPKMKLDPDLKGGWFVADTVYEKAFKYTTKVLKNLGKSTATKFVIEPKK